MSTERARGDDRVVADRLFQILIVDGGGLPETFGAQLNRNVAALRAAHPNAEHSLLSHDDLRSFISAQFSSRVLAAFDRLAPYSYKCDLGRACLLYARGGLYVDIGVRFINPMLVPAGCGLAGFRDRIYSEKHVSSVMTAVLFAAPQRPELMRWIDAIVEHAETGFYGPTPLDPTGPPLLGRMIAATNDMDAYYFGDFLAATPDRATQNTAFIDPAARLVALGKTSEGGNLGDFQSGGTNNYNDLWRARRVYGEFDTTWTFGQPDIRVGAATRTPEGIRFLPDAKGYATFGPYVTLFPGNYHATMRFGAECWLRGAAVDVTADCGETAILASTPAEDIMADARTVSFPMTIDRMMKDVEIRLHVNGESDGLLLSISVERARAA